MSVPSETRFKPFAAHSLQKLKETLQSLPLYDKTFFCIFTAPDFIKILTPPDAQAPIITRLPVWIRKFSAFEEQTFMSESKPEISVVLPCFNEAGNMEPLIGEIAAALRPLQRSFEIICVDDGSRDDTAHSITQAAARFPETRLIRHVRNYGQSAAFLTGFEHARGDILVTLDADRQNDPADIPAMLAQLPGADMVCGIRRKRRDNALRRFSTRIANAVRGFILKDGILDAGCAIKVFRRHVIFQPLCFKGLHRFWATLAVIHGFRVIQIPVNHRPRVSGVSKYGVANRLFVGIHDMFALHWYRRRRIPRREMKQP